MKTAIVTGATRGIGRGISLYLAEKGYRIIAAATRDAADVGEYIAELKALSPESAYIKCDISDAASRENLISEAKKLGAKQIVCEGYAEKIDFFKANGIPYENISYIKDGKRRIMFRENMVFDGADWLSFHGENQAVIAKKDFYLEKKEKTELYVSGLGFCYIYINGKCISDRVLAPAWTNYKEHDTASMNYPIFDKMTCRILYEKIDVTKFLKKGKNYFKIWIEWTLLILLGVYFVDCLPSI
jgi:hypothetical protein